MNAYIAIPGMESLSAMGAFGNNFRGRCKKKCQQKEGGNRGVALGLWCLKGSKGSAKGDTNAVYGM